MKIIKSRFSITKLPAGKVVRQSDVDVAAEKSFVKKFGDRPAYMGYGMEGSGSLAARDYAEKVANRVYFKKIFIIVKNQIYPVTFSDCVLRSRSIVKDSPLITESDDGEVKSVTPKSISAASSFLIVTGFLIACIV